MEESKEIQGLYSIFRIAVYVSLLLEFFEYAIPPEMLDSFGGVVTELHRRIGTWLIYRDGHLLYSKMATIILVIITCIGTRNKKHIEFDARNMVFWPLIVGFLLTVTSLWLFSTATMPWIVYKLQANKWLYMIASVIGTLAIHTALDNVSKYLKEGMLKDRFNFENESFEQNEEFKDTKYSVNIPMRYYHQGKFRH